MGIRDDQIRAELLRTKDLDLPKAVSICPAAEASRTQMDKLQTAQTERTINEVKRGRPESSKMSKESTMTLNFKIWMKKCNQRSD